MQSVQEGMGGGLLSKVTIRNDFEKFYFIRISKVIHKSMSVVRRSFDRSGLSISLHRRRPSEEQQFINLVNVYTAILPKISQEMEHEISRSIVSRQEKVAKKHEFRSKFNFSLKSLA